MPIDENILDKIRYLYEIASQIKEYWVKIQLWQCEKYRHSEIIINIYTFLDEKECKEILNSTIDLNDSKVEKYIQIAIDKMKELITNTTNDND